MRPDPRFQKLAYLWAPVIFYAAFIFFWSSFSFHFTLFEKVEKNNTDKLVHVVEYGVLGSLLARALRGRFFWTAILIGVLYGALDEFHQQFVPYRDSSVFDLTADAVGVMLGAWIWTKKQNKVYA